MGKEHMWLTYRGDVCYCKICKCEIKTMKKCNLVTNENTAKHKKVAESIQKSNNMIMKTFCKRLQVQHDHLKDFLNKIRCRSCMS